MECAVKGKEKKGSKRKNEKKKEKNTGAVARTCAHRAPPQSCVPLF